MPKPYYRDEAVTIYHGDCREVLPALPAGDMVEADPPYGETSLRWDRAVDGWLEAVRADNLWCWGSLRFFLSSGRVFAGWKMAQDLVWEKHNGSMFHADRFRRVHEHVVQFYRGRWRALYKRPVMTLDATWRRVHRKERPAHAGAIADSTYFSEEGGPRLQRSVIWAPSSHGNSYHPTEKPLTILRDILTYSCPPGGLVVVPFLGGGSTAVAAKQLGMHTIGVDNDEQNCEIAANRCRQTIMELGL